jgi:hypothetical protein
MRNAGAAAVALALAAFATEQQASAQSYQEVDLTTLIPQFGFLSMATAVEDAGFDPRGVVRLEVQLGKTGAVDELVLSR